MVRTSVILLGTALAVTSCKDSGFRAPPQVSGVQPATAQPLTPGSPNFPGQNIPGQTLPAPIGGSQPGSPGSLQTLDFGARFNRAVHVGDNEMSGSSCKAWINVFDFWKKLSNFNFKVTPSSPGKRYLFEVPAQQPTNQLGTALPGVIVREINVWTCGVDTKEGFTNNRATLIPLSGQQVPLSTNFITLQSRAVLPKNNLFDEIATRTPFILPPGQWALDVVSQQLPHPQLGTDHDDFWLNLIIKHEGLINVLGLYDLNSNGQLIGPSPVN